jgi:hypothetical protein
MNARIFLDRYKVVRPLGEGGMGKVYLAQRLTDGQPVVVKVMHDHLSADPKFRELFAREMQFMASFKHPNVVELLDASSRPADGLCIVMEYVDGVDLEAVLKLHRRLPAERVGRLLGQLCSALQAAHDHGIIHRDLKPANLMVVDPERPTEKLKVMDFGLAKLSTSIHLSLERLKGSNTIVATGTPEYLSPEQVRGDELDHRSDLYAVGVILYEMLAGRLPFERETMEETVMAHVEDTPPRFALIGIEDVPRPVEAVVMRCLSKYPVERPRDAWELGECFETALGVKILGRRPAAPAKAPAPPVIRRPVHPNAVVDEVEAWMPEPIAVLKLKGFVDDMRGEVSASEPGKVVVHFGQPNCRYQMPGAPAPAPARSGGLGSWFGLGSAKATAVKPRLIEMELLMEKKQAAAGTFLHITIAIRPEDGMVPRDPAWVDLCQRIQRDFKSYLLTR